MIILINFSLENWKSFREEATFLMVASEEDQYAYRIPELNIHKIRVLPIIAIYGGNVAGKTNFFKAIQFAKTPMVSGTRPDSFIPIEVFRLDNKMANQPSWFIFTLLADNTIYEFTFSVTRTTIMEEKLTKITRTDEKVLYDRRDGKLNFNNSLPEQQALDFTFRGTWDNQLFLTNSVFQNISTFRPVYNSTVRVVMESSDNRLNQRIAITRKDGDFIAKNLLPITKKRMARKSNLIFTRNSMAHSA